MMTKRIKYNVKIEVSVRLLIQHINNKIAVI